VSGKQIQYFPLLGGLDITTAAIVARPGTARAALNYESDITGYRRISGYERYDGQPSPTDVYDAALDIVTGAVDREAARALITEVPGSGPVRGVWYYNGSVYAFRDTVGATDGAMYKATSTGWQLVTDAFSPGGHYEFVNYNFTGASSLVKMYGINGTDKAFQFDGTNVVFITTGMAPDAPTKIEAHKRHLFLAFPGGSLQHSSIGDPLTWSPVSGAAELAMGDDITNIISAAPANMVIMSKNSVSLLYGSDASDWQIETITNEAGALEFTAEKMGPVIYVDNRGVRSMGTTPAFGNFTIGTMTQTVAPIIRGKLAAGQVPIASCRVRSRDTYRLFFDDGYVLSIYMGRKTPEIMPLDFGVNITCVVSAETEDNIERGWFGADNGFVYQMDKGRSFDGEAMQYHLRLPFNHMGGPQLIKRWHKANVEYDAASGVTLRISGEVDYADPAEPSLLEQNIAAAGGGGFWEAVNWDEFYWSSPVEGKIEVYIDAIGKSMSLLIGGEAADEEPHILQGLTLFYSVRGLKL
jgi:hypothetical protein